MAITRSPTRVASDTPRVAAGSSPGRSRARSTAMSVGGSVPTTSAENSLPSAVRTRTSLAPSTTWLFVRITPSDRITTPEPIPIRSRDGGSSPKNRRQNSRTSGGTSASPARTVLTPTTVPRTRSTRGATEYSCAPAGACPPIVFCVCWACIAESKAIAAAPTERKPRGNQCGLRFSGIEAEPGQRLPARQPLREPNGRLPFRDSNEPGVEHVAENQRSDDGRVRFDDESGRVHVELAPGDLLVRGAAAVGAVGGRAVGDLGVIRPERGLLQPQVE